MRSSSKTRLSPENQQECTYVKTYFHTCSQVNYCMNTCKISTFTNNNIFHEQYLSLIDRLSNDGYVKLKRVLNVSDVNLTFLWRYSKKATCHLNETVIKPTKIRKNLGYRKVKKYQSVASKKMAVHIIFKENRFYKSQKI